MIMPQTQLLLLELVSNRMGMHAINLGLEGRWAALPGPCPMHALQPRHTLQAWTVPSGALMGAGVWKRHRCSLYVRKEPHRLSWQALTLPCSAIAAMESRWAPVSMLTATLQI